MPKLCASELAPRPGDIGSAHNKAEGSTCQIEGEGCKGGEGELWTCFPVPRIFPHAMPTYELMPDLHTDTDSIRCIFLLFLAARPSHTHTHTPLR